jgi:hypothetical protein
MGNKIVVNFARGSYRTARLSPPLRTPTPPSPPSPGSQRDSLARTAAAKASLYTGEGSIKEQNKLTDSTTQNDVVSGKKHRFSPSSSTTVPSRYQREPSMDQADAMTGKRPHVGATRDLIPGQSSAHTMAHLGPQLRPYQQHQKRQLRTCM